MDEFRTLSTLNEMISDFAGKIREKHADLKSNLVANEQSCLKCAITAQKNEILFLMNTFSKKNTNLEEERSKLIENLASKDKQLDAIASRCHCLDNLVTSQEDEIRCLKDTVQNQESVLLTTNTELSNCQSKLQNITAAYEKQGEIFFRLNDEQVSIFIQWLKKMQLLKIPNEK